MGKHSSPQRTPFLRSIGAWALPWVLIIGVIAVALIVAFDMVDDDPVRTSSGGNGKAASTSEESESPEAESPTPEKKPKKAEREKPERDPTDEPKDIDQSGRLLTKDVSVQVLNGTGDGEADDLMADKLARLGYTVVAVSPASKAYARTTVFWVGDAEHAGELLADRFGWVLDAAPPNLSQEVELHIVVGENSL